MNSVLVTGGAGFIGSHLLVVLLEKNYECIVIDNLSNSCKTSIDRVERLTNKKVTFFQYDMCNIDEMEKLFSSYKFQFVVHLAGKKSVGESVSMPLLYYECNIGGTLNLLKMMNKYNVRNFIFSSSATVYGTPKYLPVDENHPTGNVANPYGRSKYIIEEMLKDIATENINNKIIILRYFNPIGAHESGLIGENPVGIPNNIMPYITQVACGKLEKLNVFGNDYDTIDGTGVRDYIHVMDLVEGHLAAIEKIKKDLETKENGENIKIYNLGVGKGYSVLELVKELESASGTKIKYDFVGRRQGDIAEIYTKGEFSEKELNWKTKRTIKEMCCDAWNWQKMNPNGY